MAYARRDSANDALLIAYILQAFGQKAISCLIFQILNILNTSVFLASIIGMISGIVTIVKGLKLISTGKAGILTKLTSILALIVPKRFLGRLGVLLIWLGGIEAAGSALIIFLTSIANNVALFLLMRDVCNSETLPYPIAAEPFDVGNLDETIKGVSAALKDAAEAERKTE